EATGGDRGVTFYKVEPASFDLPSVIEIGLAYTSTIDDKNKVQFAGAFQNNNFADDEYRLGAEYAYDQMFFIRAGGLLTGSGSDLFTTDDNHIFENFTFGAGVKFKEVGGTDVSFDYAFVPARLFSANHVISLRLGF